MINLKYQHILKVVLTVSLLLNNTSSDAGSCLSRSALQQEDELFKQVRKHPINPDDYRRDKDPIFSPTSTKQPQVKGDKLKKPFYGSVKGKSSESQIEELESGSTSTFLALATQLREQEDIKAQEASKNLGLAVKIGLNLLSKFGA